MNPLKSLKDVLGKLEEMDIDPSQVLIDAKNILQPLNLMADNPDEED